MILRRLATGFRIVFMSESIKKPSFNDLLLDAIRDIAVAIRESGVTQAQVNELVREVNRHRDIIRRAESEFLIKQAEEGRNKIMPLDLQPLVDAVAGETTDLDSFVVFVNQLKQQLADALAGDPAAQAKVDAVLEQILANRQKIVDAMNANVV